MNKKKNHVEIFKKLTKQAIDDLVKLPQPIARISGPLTTGGFGYEKNARRFAVAETFLRNKGITIFSYEKYEDAIYDIYEPEMHSDVMEYFHRPILEAGHIREVYFLPHWEKSKGATQEHKIASALGIKITNFKEEWF